MVSVILVTGANGQLGSELTRLLGQKAIFLTRAELDYSNSDELIRVFDKYKFHSFVNTVAYNQVDLAEDERDLSMQINGHAPGILAEECKKRNIQFVHYSTDYVFDGKSSEPYLETSKTAPINFYGKTKLAGEESVLAANSKSMVIRTSWVFSSFAKNFVKTIINAGQMRDQLKVVNDQIGSPTWAMELAKVTALSLEKKLSGIYHYSQEGHCSWYEYAEEIKKLAKFKAEILSVPASEYVTKATRPKYSLLSKNKIHRDLNIQIPEWKTCLALMYQDLTKTP